MHTKIIHELLNKVYLNMDSVSPNLAEISDFHQVSELSWTFVSNQLVYKDIYIMLVKLFNTCPTVCVQSVSFYILPASVLDSKFFSSSLLWNQYFYLVWGINTKRLNVLYASCGPFQTRYKHMVQCKATQTHVGGMCY